MTTQTIKLLIIIVCMILLWFGIQGIRTGRVREEGNEIIDRDRSPVQFRLTVGIYMGLGIAGIFYALFFSIGGKLIMKPVTTIVAILLTAISIVHLLRLMLQVEIIASGVKIPMWLSIRGCIVPAILVFMLWRETESKVCKRSFPVKKK